MTIITIKASECFLLPIYNISMFLLPIYKKLIIQNSRWGDHHNNYKLNRGGSGHLVQS